MYLRNCWYVAAWDSEVGGAPFARTITEVPVMLYRTADGSAVALEDRCCHRNLPLSLGTVEGDAIRCGYHGLKYDATGACIEIPGQKLVPPGARVRRFPLVEKWNMLWIWMGDPALADERLLPQWDDLDDPRLVSSHGNERKPLYMRCNWELNNDNLLDLSHVFYVHKATLGGEGFDLYPVKTVRAQRGVRMSRWLPNTAPVPIFAQYLDYKGGEVDRWQGADIEAPTHCVVDAGFAPPGAIDPDDLEGRMRFVRLRAFITATPETPTTSFMFYIQSRNFAVDNEPLTGRLMTDFRRVFDQDVAVMEGQQRASDAWPDAPTIDINVDAPPLAMRRLMRQLIADENGAAAA